jgi:hypothetical protein
MKDTAILIGTMGIMAEQFLGRQKRRDLWSSWGSLWSMLPKGGNAFWGIGSDICPFSDDRQKNETTINDPFCPRSHHDMISPMIVMTDSMISKSHYTIGMEDAYKNGTNLN